MTRTIRSNRARAALAGSGAGILAGVVGLTVLALPDSADAAPELPDIGAAELVTSVASNEPPAMSGTVRVENNLGLPSLPGSGSPLTSDTEAKVWYDGDRGARVALSDEQRQRVMVHNASTTWLWDSSDRTVVKMPTPKTTDDDKAPRLSEADLQGQVSQLLEQIRSYSTVEVDGTASVAGRDAYELSITPKPTERTLLRSVRIAVDAQTRTPLRMQVLASDQSAPALSVGFTEVAMGEQPDRLFTFQPPEQATISTPDDQRNGGKDAMDWSNLDLPQAVSGGEGSTDTVGEGWDTVVTGRLPGDTLEGTAGGRTSPKALLDQAADRIEGPWGAGYVLTTKVGTALITDDGRFAAGAVPQQLLVDAVGNMR